MTTAPAPQFVVRHESFRVRNEKAKPAFHNVTAAVRELVAKHGVRDGLCTVYSQHTTCSVILQEESHDTTLDGTEYLMQDLLNALASVMPRCEHDGQYLHPGPRHLQHAVGQLGEQGWWSLNTDAHLRSCLLGRSQVVPLRDGSLVLGEFGQIYFVDFDTVRQRERTVCVQLMGQA